MSILFEYYVGIAALGIYVIFIEKNYGLGMALVLSHIYNAIKIYRLEKKIEKDIH